MKKRGHDSFLALAGILLLGAGLFLLKTIDNLQSTLQALPYILIGLGCGLFGHGMGNVISRKALKNNPNVQKRMEIEKNDERNLAISYRAKAKAYDMMVLVFGALMISFALMNVDVLVILLLVFAYLFVIGGGVYYRVKFDKEM
ncbi:DUF6442 family protein [Gorillibacterium massiliense]|uniref:DUF6442 family protein n=1 Tax=Gorillibacterium massiliense TaxID=1280390 RepID=UPI0004B0823E|nr:DUF6442 family protein [Gorillibacterium massiliense]